MYYFKHLNDKLLSFDIKAKYINADSEGTLKIILTEKLKINVFLYDENSNLIPITKSSFLYKNIIENMLKENWSIFMIDDISLEGFVDEENNKISAIQILLGKQKKNKENPYSYLLNYLKDYNLPLFNEEDILMKKMNAGFLHIYYRKNDMIIHICFNNIEENIESYEIFKK